MGYKVLGFAVWQGSKWYLRRRMGGARAKVAIAGVGAAVVAGVLVAGRQATSGDLALVIQLAIASAEPPIAIDRVERARGKGDDVRLRLSGRWLIEDPPGEPDAPEPLLVIQLQGRRHRFPADRATAGAAPVPGDLAGRVHGAHLGGSQPGRPGRRVDRHIGDRRRAPGDRPGAAADPRARPARAARRATRAGSRAAEPVAGRASRQPRRPSR